MMTRLGPFQILEEVGRGGMGTVYRGLDPVIGRPVAIKVIRLLGYKDQEEQVWMRARLFREARAAGGLCHPGIVTIYQVGEDEDVAYIAMEFVEGATLKQMLECETPIDKRKLCSILFEAAAALDYAHDRGLVHRDIKPENIMVSTAGVTKVTDFGIAKTMLGQTATRTDGMAGTPLYMSPEQIRGKQLDGRSDQFALAVIAYRMFTGRAPFEAEHITSVCYQIIHEEPVSPEDLCPGIGGEIAKVIKRGLAKEPDARFATCSEFASALLAAYDRRPSTARRVVADLRVTKPSRRTLGRMIMALGLATVLVGGSVAFTRRPLSAPGPLPQSLTPTGTAFVPEAGSNVSPILQPHGREEGVMVWTGKARQGDVVRIVGTHCSKGVLTGSLPVRPARITVYPGIARPGEITAFTWDTVPQTVHGVNFVFDPRHATDVRAFAEPDGVTIQVNTDVDAMVMRWAEQ